MKSGPLEKAKVRLRFAHRAFALMTDPSPQSGDTYDHWIDFLTQWKGAYTKVQQAAKDTPQELQWFGKINRERKGNPITRYLFEARNDEEHGLANSATLQKGQAVFRMLKGSESGANLTIENNEAVRIVDDNGAVIAERLSIRPLIAELHDVKDRGGNNVPAPKAQDGSPLSPVMVAEAGLRYLEALVAQAEAMHTPSK